MDCSPLGSSVHGIFQERILDQVAVFLPTQKSNPCLLDWQEDSLPLYCLGSHIYMLLVFFWLCWVFVAVRGLSLVAASWGHFLVVVLGLLIAVASLVAEHGL